MASLRLILAACLVLLALATPASAFSSKFLEMLPGEGTACTALGVAGTCTAGACSGQKVAGKCPGPASVQCCVKKPSGPSADPAKAAAKPSATGRLSLAGPFPYKFPYSNKRYVVADIEKQRIRVYDGSTFVKEWKMSSGKKGVSFAPESWASPIGRFRIIGKYGNGAPLGMIFEGMRATGQIGKPTDAMAHVQTRILQLTGLDKENANTASRAIYIHGTNAEMQLGWKGSHGCFRMGNADVIELFNMINIGTEYFVAPQNAWP